MYTRYLCSLSLSLSLFLSIFVQALFLHLNFHPPEIHHPEGGEESNAAVEKKNQLRGRNEQGATTGRLGDGFCGMRIASGNDEKTGESPYFFVRPARARARY